MSLQIVKGAQVTSRYGVKRNIVANGKTIQDMHNGLDIVSKFNDDDLLSLYDGKVLFTTENDGTGCKTIVTAHGGVIQGGCVLLVLYAHCDKILVKQGQNIRRGQVVGKMGNTGLSTAKHLHTSMYVIPSNKWHNKTTNEWYKWDYKTRDDFEINPNKILKLYKE